MTSQEKVERAAVLMCLLAPETVETILAGPAFGPELADALRTRLATMRQESITQQQVDGVLDEFASFLKTARPEALLRLVGDKDADSAGPNRPVDDESPAGGSSAPDVSEFDMSEDPFDDLKRLEPFQTAGALRDEKPRIVALVLSCLEPEQAGEVMGELPGELRNEAFLILKASPTAPEILLRRIVQATVERGCRLDRSSLQSNQEESDHKVAELLRSLSREERAEAMQALEADDPETAARIKDMLYMFEDLAHVEDRSMQKLLAEVDAQMLAKAIKDSEPALFEKVTGNLSKRARESLLEEIEYMGKLSDDEQQEAKKGIVEVLARLDQAGELEMMS